MWPRGWVLWEGSPGLQREIRDQGDTSALKPVLGGGGGLGAHSPSRKDHLSHDTWQQCSGQSLFTARRPSSLCLSRLDLKWYFYYPRLTESLSSLHHKLSSNRHPPFKGPVTFCQSLNLSGRHLSPWLTVKAACRIQWEQEEGSSPPTSVIFNLPRRLG